MNVNHSVVHPHCPNVEFLIAGEGWWDRVEWNAEETRLHKGLCLAAVPCGDVAQNVLLGVTPIASKLMHRSGEALTAFKN